jgi:hypothetical protein
VTRIFVRIHTRGVSVRKVMETLDPHVLGALVTTAGSAFAMVWLATRLNTLERREEMRCPACGRLRQRGFCACSR